MRQRIGESIEQYRERDAAAHRRRYQRTGRPAGRPRTRAESCSECDDEVLASSLCYRHYRAAKRAEGISWADEGSKGFKKRAERYGVAFEPISRIEIFERDGWICGICGEPVDRLLRSPNQMSPSLDHRLPMALGGAHLRANVQCSHLICNIRKGARVAKEV